MAYRVTQSSGKVYTHATGLSVAFRQYRAKSHCCFLHGYALQVELQFKLLSEPQDSRIPSFPERMDESLTGEGWVMDFGGLQEIRQMLIENFDHRTVVERSDPQIGLFKQLEKEGVAQLRIVERVGMESFAQEIASSVITWMKANPVNPKAYLAMVKVSEHEGNYACWHSEPLYNRRVG